MKGFFRSFWLFLVGLPRYVYMVVGSLTLFYLVCLNYIEPAWVGISKNYVSGRMWLQGPGWHLTGPWTLVARVDTRPMRVGIPTAGRGFSAKLVQFEPSAWREFIATEGFRYYWWANRVSINFGNEEEYRGMRNILLGYAYSPKRYPFVKVLEEYQQSQ